MYISNPCIYSELLMKLKTFGTVTAFYNLDLGEPNNKQVGFFGGNS